jgi:hypothetical protein
MDSQLSEPLDLICRLEESARRGDWATAGNIAASLRGEAVPPTREGLAEYLRCLKKALIAAKTSRAHAAASLVRLNAAARFNGTRMNFAASRQDPGEVADSWRPQPVPSDTDQ